jgi:hypothetical protein
MNSANVASIMTNAIMLKKKISSICMSSGLRTMGRKRLGWSHASLSALCT